MKTKRPLTQKPSEHVEHLLDEALAQTFPASDPIAVSPPPSFRRDVGGGEAAVDQEFRAGHVG
jgi:hypothetical protein